MPCPFLGPFFFFIIISSAEGQRTCVSIVAEGRKKEERDRDILARSAFYDGPRDVCVSLPGEMTAVSGPLSSPLYDDAAAAQKLWMILQGNSAQTLLMASSDKYVPRSILLSHGSLSAFAVDVRGTGKKKKQCFGGLYILFSLSLSALLLPRWLSARPTKFFIFPPPKENLFPGFWKLPFYTQGCFISFHKSFALWETRLYV